MSVLSNLFNSISQDHIPPFIVMDLMYRDGANYKTSESYSFKNDSGLTMAQLTEWLNEYMPTEEILASKHGLPNLAPLDNITDIGNDDDHCFMELTDFSVAETANGPHITPSDTPFSEIYQKTIDACSEEGLQAAAIVEQQNLLARLETDTQDLLMNYANVNQGEMVATLSTIAARMAQACGQKLVPVDTAIVKDGETVFPAHIDMALINTIIYSALNHTKTRADLVSHYGEAALAKLHVDFLRLTGRT